MCEIDIYVDDRQIDLEEAIAAVAAGSNLVFKLPATVTAYAEHNGQPLRRVYRAVEDGFLEADRRVRPMLITGGEMPITTREWHLALAPAVKKIKPSVLSWTDTGRQLNLLGSDGTMYEFRLPKLKHVADQQRREIERIKCARVDDGGKP